MKKIDWKRISLRDLAQLVSSELAKHNINAVLVGGACVSIYTNNKYLSLDLDYISYTPLAELNKVMESLGFHRQSSRHFEHRECRFFVEFPPPPIAIGKEMPITRFHRMQSLLILTPTDCVKDRLMAYYHWNDPQSLEQALMVARAQKVNLKNIERWSAGEGATEKYLKFKYLVRKRWKGRNHG